MLYKLDIMLGIKAHSKLQTVTMHFYDLIHTKQSFILSSDKSV